MKNGSTLFLRLAILAMGLAAVAVCGLAQTVMQREWPVEFPHMAHLTYPVILGLSTAMITFVVALYHVWRLLGYIDKNKAFSELSVKTLQNVKYCAFIISGVFAAGMPVVFQIADKEDAPGMILIFGAVFIGAPIVIAVFAGVCQRLFQNAINIKSENDLTV